MSSESFVFDFDEIENNGPYCKLPPYFLPPLTGFVEQVTGLFLRERDRVRRILIDGTLRSLAAAGDPMTAVLLFDGGEKPRLTGAIVNGNLEGALYRGAGLNLNLEPTSEGNAP